MNIQLNTSTSRYTLISNKNNIVFTGKLVSTSQINSAPKSPINYFTKVKNLIDKLFKKEVSTINKTTKLAESNVELKEFIDVFYKDNFRIENKYKISTNGEKYLYSYNKYDEKNRFCESKSFDELGKVLSKGSKEYLNGIEIITPEGKTAIIDRTIEKVDDLHQSYVRTSDAYTLEGFSHYNEEFVSITNPDVNYVHHAIRKDGKLISFVCNGKETLFK